MRRFQRIIEPIDDYLSSVGLYRKVTAKDGSCLFRAVAEQVFHTQALHVKVREACIQYMENNKDRFAPFVEGPFDHHLYKLKNPKEWAGQVEISALSLMYKRDFHVYQEPGMGAFNVTQNGFPDKVVLCFSHGNHYDSVFSRKFQENAAITQAVIYEILYKDVFKLSKQVDEAVDILRCSNKKPRRDSNCSAEGLKERDDRECGIERDGRDRYGRFHEEKRRPPLPYRVAKALDPEIYRNVEFDAWNEERKEQQHQDFLLASGMQYVPGDKCQVFLDDPKKMYNAHIQDVQSCNGPVTVFIEDLGEKHTIPMKNLRPTDPSHRPWSPLSGRHYKNLTSYYHKFTNGVASDSEVYRMKAKAMRKVGPMMSQPPNVPFNSHYSSPAPPNNSQGFDHGQPHQHPPFIRPLMQHDKQSPRSTSPYQKGKGNGRCNHTMHNSYPNSMVQEEYDEKRALEESLALFELQERDSNSFPALPGHQSGRINLASPVNLWDKFRKEGRKSVSPIQRINTPSPVAMFDGRGNFGGENIQGRFQDMSLHDNGRGDGQGAPNSGRNHFSRDNYHTNQQRENTATSHDYSPNAPKWHSSNSTLSTSGSNACHSAGNTPSPPSVPMMPGYNAGVPIGIPLYPMVIPLTDNLTGPVNASATASRDPNGYDLPLSDVSTMRYYYNLGIEYHHRLYLFQIQQWQQQQQQSQQQHQQQQLPMQQSPDHPPCAMVSQTPHQQPAQQHVMQTSVTTHYSPEGPVSVGGNASEEEVDEGMQQRVCASNGPTQSYYIESPVHQHLAQQQQQQQPTLQPPPAPVNTFFNPHANPTGIQTEPYAHVNYHPAPPGNLGTYQYPVQGQWQPAFPYGSPVKVPTVAYGQSPPVTFIANTAPASAPALYIPATH
ncbi:putative bifunctional UDP-N-acetylglucosamine transferase and deubiquitinase ALG13 isoform X2 [Asterias rubens]|uniref:putative bifunctional UDP-N-acetylglucosamine transferase and deubiquitinase ALG13 isoform X2 n=1 Tax=Asterias rubens TaxID=7604 RepID=UPI00145589B3|nr:putative bifunctional UDP-N-acetylglucosamine transferase and deubiquitinase ALG13 isoform X2 [Asterias rubens]